MNDSYTYISENVSILTPSAYQYSELRNLQEKLSRDKLELSKAVDELKSEKRELSEKLKTKERDFAELENQAKSHDEGIKEKMILRERVAVKDEKIRHLNEIVENQNLKLDKLDAQLISANRSFEEREVIYW